MELIEIAALIGARRHTRKPDIAHEGMKFLPRATEREMLKAIDKLTANGYLLNRRLGEYEIMSSAEVALLDDASNLEAMSNEIRYGRVNR